MIGALAAGGAAFTASDSMPSENVAGYGNIQVTGANVTKIANTMSTDGQNITKVVLTFGSALSSDITVKVGWGPTPARRPRT